MNLQFELGLTSIICKGDFIELILHMKYPTLIEGVQKLFELAQKLANGKNSTILIQSS
jgi:hypothetical protein